MSVVLMRWWRSLCGFIWSWVGVKWGPIYYGTKQLLRTSGVVLEDRCVTGDKGRGWKGW